MIKLKTMSYHPTSPRLRRIKVVSPLRLRSGISSAFTIVELLVVIVVIGILATITIVSYTGITGKATIASLESDLDNASKQIKLFQVTEPSGNYPTANVCPSPGATEICLKASGSNSYSYLALNEDNPKRFTLDATSGTTTYRITNDSAPVAVNELFSDGFETGDLAGWTSSLTDSGNLSASTGAKLHGNYGLSVFINDTNDIYAQDNIPNGEKRYRVRYYIDPNAVTITGAQSIRHLIAYNSTWGATINVVLNYNSPNYKIMASSKTDTGSVETQYFIISDTPHYVEIDWKASSAAGANDGFLELIIDGVSKETLTGIDCDSSICVVDTILFGAKAPPSGTSGTFYLDDFVSNNDGSEIGPI